jgi:hypothetical protein
MKRDCTVSQSMALRAKFASPQPMATGSAGGPVGWGATRDGSRTAGLRLALCEPATPPPADYSCEAFPMPAGRQRTR